MKVTGGDGSSIKNAIVISDCNNSDGIRQEYIEVQSRFGNYKLIQQSLLNVENQMYDKLELEIEGEKIELFFNITDFFGKGFEF
jgi:hypothetical protein